MNSVKSELRDRMASTDGFDADWYLARYPDVSLLRMDALEHYLWIGARLGRKANAQAKPGHMLSIAESTVAAAPRPHFKAMGRHIAPLSAVFMDDTEIAPDHLPQVSVGIHAHMYYSDLAPEFALYLDCVPCPFDLYVSVPDDEARAYVIAEFRGIRNLGRLDVRIVPNIGRDIGPFVVEFAKDLSRYDICAHVQSKKSLYNQGATDGWRQYVLKSLFENPERISSFIAAMASNQYGIIYPQTYFNIPYAAHTWLANSGLARQFGPRFNVTELPDGYFDFPAGSMFWARTDAIRPLLEANLEWSDFPAEQGQTDGTLAHCIERMLGLIPTALHYQHGVIVDKQTPSWSRWRLNQYLDRSLEYIQSIITDPAIKVVAFDVFDTLLVRPFLDADYVKTLLDDEYQEKGLPGFQAARASHEGAVRQAKGRDVDIHDIYDTLAIAIGQGDLIRKEREIELEIATVRPRADVVELFDLARRHGKRVVLASDMFLPRDVIETMLRKCGIDGWDHFYLSCEVGVRKDNSDLYKHMLAAEGLSPGEMLMIGDNERSDLQIPSDMGLQAVHLLKPVNLLRALPRFADIVPDARQAGPGEQFVFGAIAAESFSRISFADFSADDMFGSAREIGYGLLGPIIAGFCQWLDRQVEEEGLDRLYFLAREGKFLKRAYDFWQSGRKNPIRTEYLLVSRRAVTVPCIASLTDALDIARANDFHSQPMEAFLIERFGVTLPDPVWRDVAKRGIWERKRPVQIKGGAIDHLKPFLTAILPHILKQAALEREAAEQYLSNSRVGETGGALVDVGYAGTIQRHLIKLLNRNVPGLYLMTDEKGHAWGMHSGATIKGCYVEGAEHHNPETPLMFSRSFLLEKMLSAHDHQVMRYSANGKVEYRVIEDHADKGTVTRIETQDAAIRFVADTLRAQDELFGKIDIPLDLSQLIYGRFVSDLSSNEQAVLSDLELDDFYCGRGIVS